MSVTDTGSFIGNGTRLEDRFRHCSGTLLPSPLSVPDSSTGSTVTHESGTMLPLPVPEARVPVLSSSTVLPVMIVSHGGRDYCLRYRDY
eukprot:672508-Rhodomonas_salina.2